MKRKPIKMLYGLLAAAMALLLSGCGVTHLSLSPAQSSAVSVVQTSAAVSFSAEQTRQMSNYMLANRFVHQDKMLVGSRHDETGLPYLCRMKFTAGQSGMYVRETEPIETGVDAQYLALEGEYLYYLRIDCHSGSTSVCRVPAAFGSTAAPETVYAAPCDFLFLFQGRLYLTDASHHLISMKPDGTDLQFVLSDKEIYYPYLLSSELLLYQDDADGESLRLRYLPTGFDLQILPGRALSYVLQDGALYVLQADAGEKCTLCRVELNAFLKDFRPTERPNAAFTFAVERGSTLGPRFSINGSRISASNHQSAALSAWQTLSDTAYTGYTSACQYVTENFELLYDYNAEGKIESMYFYEPLQQRSGYIEVYRYA